MLAAPRLLAASCIAVILAAGFALVASEEPLRALRAFFLSPFASWPAVLTMLELAAPLAVCALGASTAFRAGHFSLGGEGQAYAGILAAALVGGLLGGRVGPASLPLALAAGATGGMLVALPPALGKRLAGADVLLTSFLVSQAAVLIVDWAIGSAFRDTASNLVALPAVPRAALLPRLLRPSALTPAPLAALALCIVAWYFFDRTRTGRMLDLYGRNPRFARLQGFPAAAFDWVPVLAAGALHGLAGAFMALGSNGTAVRGMSGGIGWSAIGVALVAGNEPLAVGAAALLFAWLDAGARQASILSDLPPEVSTAIKAVVLLLITAKPAIRALSARTATRASR